MDREKKKVCILGAGALGCLYGGLLSENPALDVCLIARNGEKAAFLENQGILLTEKGVERRIPVRCFASGDVIGEPDFVIVLVKAHETEGAFSANRRLFSDRTFVLTLQNGLGGADFLRRNLPVHLFAAGISRHNSTLLAPGRILHGGEGQTVLGAFSPEGETCAGHFLALFRSSSIAAEKSAHIQRTLWEKLFVNLALNPLTMLHRVKNGRIAEDASLRREAAFLVEEALAVARAEGIETGTLQEEMDRVCRVALATGKGTSSMLQDRLCGKKTEIDALNGMVVLLAEKHQINVPHNRQIIALVHEAEQEG